MKIGIVLDNYKLETFRKVLTEAGYSFTEHSRLTVSTMLLKVETKDAAALGRVVRRAEQRCRRLKQ